MIAHNKRILSTTVDKIAVKNPENRFAVIPRGPDLTDGFQDLSFKDLARAVNYLSWWIDSTIGPAKSPETLAYMGSNDMRYFMFMLACQKTGYKAFLPSTRNSDEAHLHLLKATNCKRFFFSKERHARIMEIKNLASDLETLEIPTMTTIFSSEDGLRHYPYEKSYAGAETETFCTIHSSGTTGMPKPVHLTNGFFMTMDSISQLDWPAGREPTPFFHMSSQDVILATTPFFHLMGIIPLIFAVWFDVSALVGPDKPLSVDYMVELLRRARPTAAICPPSVLEDLSSSDEALACLDEVDSIYYGGAPLALEVGEKLRNHTRVKSLLGTSEIGFIPSIVPADSADWNYFEWNASYGIDMQDIGDGQMHEMVIPRQPNSLEFQGIFHTYPDINEYRTNDLYTRHPTNPNLWKFYGRKDDVIVLSNGEKFNPVGMEEIIECHPLVSRALVIGQSRFQAGLLVEPHRSAQDMDSKLFIEEIWPTVQSANQTIAAHGRVMKTKIAVASKAKPFQRTPKGSTKRRAVLQDYEEEIDALYNAGLTDEDQALPEILDQNSVTEWIRDTIIQALEKPDISDAEDFYSSGLDSLMTIQVARIINKGIQTRQPNVEGAITAQTLYSNPTVSQLSQVVMATLEGKAQGTVSREEKIQELLEKYTADLPAKKRNDCRDELSSPTTIILTGSTGSLGNYLLHSLLSLDSVSKVYCLNRSEAETRQKSGLEEKGLNLNPKAWEKVEFLKVSFGEPQFGLDESKYQELLETVDTIIHNAWMVNFNHSVDSFEAPHIQGVRHLVEFSLKSRYNAHIHFVSSVSTVGGWSPEMGPKIPEVPMEDLSVVLEQGYGESKHVAERICWEASRRSGVPTTVYRVGQIAGPTSASGQWNPHEWFPTIIATSKAMGKIPDRLGAMPIDWVPVDTLASIMVEIAHTRHRTQAKNPSAVFHLTSPEAAEWSSLIPAVQEVYPVEVVGYGEWVAELESISNPTREEIAEKPALKLLDFYRALQHGGAMSIMMDVSKAKEASTTMSSLGPVSASLMRNWLQQWKF
ncbi:hypothetical protein N7520_010911 [Penicillium odoratum]|uniref:uncharacterized protein n=1 Tax=Penicillium odoratum TaxID=1167516 RepID=UPI002548331F|nr:uncharacterized protein N7520_010911 [Penicillium odoratum]KAJ5745729.1 hypothetical protein N7520_010911 [Penicillium odoratum]